MNKLRERAGAVLVYVCWHRQVCWHVRWQVRLVLLLCLLLSVVVVLLLWMLSRCWSCDARSTTIPQTFVSQVQ